MTSDVYRAVDEYFAGLFDDDDPGLEAALARSDSAGLPAIAISPMIGRLLRVLALACNARTVLEIGTLGGYSALWLASGLPQDGRVVSIEVDPRHAVVARENIARANAGDRIEVRVGDALDVLANLREESHGPFDMVFIDADKPPYAEYFEAALALSRPGTLLVADNIVRRGAVTAAGGDAAAQGARRFNARVASDPRVEAAFIQQVGLKGHDGMAVAVVIAGGSEA